LILNLLPVTAVFSFLVKVKKTDGLLIDVLCEIGVELIVSDGLSINNGLMNSKIKAGFTAKKFIYLVIVPILSSSASRPNSSGIMRKRIGKTLKLESLVQVPSLLLITDN